MICSSSLKGFNCWGLRGKKYPKARAFPAERLPRERGLFFSRRQLPGFRAVFRKIFAMDRLPNVIAALLATMLAADTAFGVDVVRLKNGRTIRGDIIGRTRDGITLHTPAARILVPNAGYATITREDRPDWYHQEARALPPGKAAELYERALAAHPGNKTILPALIEAYLKLGRHELRSGSLPAARLAFAKALAFAPDSQPARDGRLTCKTIERRTSGKMRFDGGIEDIARLRATLEKAIAILPARPAGGSETGRKPPDEPPHGQVGPRRELTSEHFIILHHDEELAKAAADTAEDAYAASLRALGRTDPRTPRATMHLIPTRAEFARHTGNSVITGHATVGGTICIYASAPDAIRSTVRHEAAHLAAFRTVGKLPMWADEGLAIRQEPDCWLHYVRMRQIVGQGRFIPLEQLLKIRSAEQLETKAEIDLFYQQAFTFVDFLIERHGGVETVVEFARATAETDIPTAAARVLRITSLQELQQQWVSFVQQ